MIDIDGFFSFLDVDFNNAEAFAKLDSPQMVSAMTKDMKYFTKPGGKQSFPFSIRLKVFTVKVNILLPLRVSYNTFSFDFVHSLAEELSLKPVTNWVIADLANEEGRALVKAALKQMVMYFEIAV